MTQTQIRAANWFFCCMILFAVSLALDLVLVSIAFAAGMLVAGHYVEGKPR